VRTDIDSNRAILSLLKLVAKSASYPVTQIPFPAFDDPDGSGNVEVTQSALADAVHRFLAVRGPTGALAETAPTPAKARATRRARRRAARRAGARLAANIPAGLVADGGGGRQIGRALHRRLSRLPVFYPTLMATGGRYRPDDARAYTIRDHNG